MYVPASVSVAMERWPIKSHAAVHVLLEWVDYYYEDVCPVFAANELN